MLKKIVMLCVSMLLALVAIQVAYASPSFVSPLNQAMATTGLSCNACHVGATNGSTATQPLVAAWNNRNATPMTQVDSDGDGVSNGLEVRLGTDVNVNTSLPQGAGANGIFVTTASSVVTAAATDLAVETSSAFSLTSPDTILDAKSITPTLATAGSVTLAFEASNVTNAKVYQVVGATATELTPVTVNANGSITFTTTDAQPKLFVVGAFSGTSAAGLTHGEASIYGCLSPVSAMPWMMLGMMFTLIMLARRRFR